MRYILSFFLLLCVYINLNAQCPGTNLCGICQADLTVTSFSGGNIINGTSTIPGTILAGGTATGDTIVVEILGCGVIDISVELDFVWEQGSGINWIHGVSFQASDGWDAAEVVLPTDDWIFQDTLNGACSGLGFGAGYYYDPIGEDECGGFPNLPAGDRSSWNGNNCFTTSWCEANSNWLTDGLPFDNWGDECEFDCPEFGFDLSFCPQISETTIETLGFFITDDAITGAWWDDDGCIFDLNFIIKFVPSLLSEEINSCEGECVTLDAGTGCDSYLWSTGETSSSIVVCPSIETEYTLEASSVEGCLFMDTITVFPEFCCEAMAGDLNGDDTCPGESLTVTVSNFQTLDIYDEYVIVTDENGIIIEIINGTSVTIESEICTTFIVHAYNHYTGDDSPVPILGDDINSYDCENNCCDLVALPVSFEDDIPPEFTNAPEDEQIDCIDNVEDPIDLNWTDNCGLAGTVPVDTEIIDATLCEGGTIERTWMTVDSCGNETTHTQTLNILPLAPPEFVNPPGNETHECTYEIVVSDLEWTNGLTDNCEASGFVPGELSGSHDVCGGEYTIEWEYTDECDQTVSHQQQIQIEPAPEAIFIDPPSDISLNCESIPLSFDELDYSNDLTGTCGISGSVEPETSGTYDVCGGTLMNQWLFTDECDRTIMHSQQVTILPADAPEFIDPPQDITVSCDDIPSSSFVISYSNNLSGDCEIAGDVLGELSQLNPCTNSITEEWMFTDLCGEMYEHSRTITINDLNPIEFENIPVTITVSCDDVAVNLIDLTFTNNGVGACLIEGTESPSQSGSYDECGGTITLTWETTDECGTEYSATQDIIVEPASEASFLSTPTDITVSCENIPDPQNISVSNGLSGVCSIMDIVEPTTVDNYDACGGTITNTWVFTDDCDRTIQTSQTITVTEADAPEYVNPPDDITLSCDDADVITNLINYSNGASGNCLISGSSVAIQTGSYDVCGGILTQSWSETDECDRLITHVRTITVDPAPDPEFINPPVDITLNCGQEYEDPEDLFYSNSEQGICSIQGSVEASVQQDGDVYTHSWNYINDCNGEEIEHIRTVTLSPDLSLTVDPTIINICLGDSYDLGLINVIDNNGQSFDIEYFEGYPSNTGDLLSNLIVTPSQTQLYTISVFNDLGCEEEVPITIFVDLPPFAGDDSEVELCVPGQVDLVEALGDNYTPGGVWEDLDNANVNLDNPEAIVIGSQEPGIYNFSYSVESGNTCPADEAIISVNYFELIPIEIDTIFCTENNTTYTVELQSFDATISTTFGDVMDQGDGTVIVSGIPIDEAITITYFDPVNFCVGFINLNPPNCDCPQVEPPEGSNVVLCESEQSAVLYGTYEDGLTLHWYENIDDDEPILSGIDSLVIENLSAGIYSFYLQTESIEFPGCFSATFTEVTLEVVASPPLTDPGDISFCFSENDLPLTLDLSQYNTQINSNLDNQFVYYETLGEAYAQMNGFTIYDLTESDSIYVLVTSVFGCSSVIGFDIILNENPTIELDITNPLCFDQNGLVEILEPINISDYNVFLDGALIEYPDGLTNLAPNEYELVITDKLIFCTDTINFIIDQGQIVTLESISYECNNNDTGTDSTDDFYTITFNISSSISSSLEFELVIDQEIIGSFSFGMDHSVEVPASGDQITINFIDLETQCSIEEISIPLNPCSTNCEITLDVYDFVCYNNDTSTDPLDDEITISINASSINGSTSNTYTVQINNVSTFVFEYGVLSEFTLPADGTTPTIVLVDSEDNQCQLIIDVDALDPCSSDCALVIDAFSLECFDNDTEDVLSDDFYTLMIDLLLFNGAISEEVYITIDDNPAEIYNLNNIVINLNADDQEHVVIIQDLDSLFCSDTLEIGPLVPCSSPCSVILDLFEFECNNNGTDLDPADDFITVQWTVSSIDGSANNQYQVFIDDDLFGVYTYGALVTEIFNNLDGSEIQLQFIDSQFNNCFNSENLLLEPCSDACDIIGNFENIICDNNGTNNTSEDDIFYFTVNVTGTNVSSNWNILNETTQYLYGADVELGPYSIQDGNVQLSIVDGNNQDCPLLLDVSPPDNCSECIQTVQVGDSIQIDCAMKEAILVGISSEPGNYSWTGPQGFISADSVTISEVTGWHYFEASYSDGCSAIDSLFIFSEDEIPIALGGPDSLITCLNELIVLTGNFDNNGTMESYWEDANGEIISNNTSVDITESGFYYFFVIDTETGCLSAPDEVFVGLDIEEPDAIIFADPNNILDCKIEVISLSHSFEQDVIYEWEYNSTISTQSIFEIDTSGMVILTATDTITGCTSIDTVEIQELEEFPIINVGPYVTLNCVINQTTLDVSASIPFESSVFEWYNSNNELISTDPSIEVVDSGMYIVIVTDTISGCENSDTLEVEATLTVPDLSVSEDVSFNCNDETLELNAFSNSGGNYLWSTANGTIVSGLQESTLIVSAPGLYLISLLDPVSQCEILDTIIVTEDFNTLQLINWQSNDESCFEINDGSINLGEITGGAEPYEITLNETSVTQDDLFDLSPGNYNLLIVDSEGCIKDTSFLINAANNLTITAPDEIVLELGNNGDLSVTTNIPANAIDTIIWSPTDYLDCTNCLENNTSTPEDIVYIVTIIDVNGCIVSTEINIRVEDDPSIYTPNVITPNDDGINDVFTIFTDQDMIISELAIYNRWGERVFFTENIPSNNLEFGWDGSFKGETVNPAVFAFYALVELPDGAGIEKVIGDVTVLK